MEQDNNFGLIDYLILASQNKLNLRKDNYKDLFVVIEDLYEDNVIHIDFINYLFKELSIEINISPYTQYIKLINYPDIIELIFKYIWNIPIYCYRITDRPTNIVMIFPFNDDNLNILKTFCQNSYWSFAIYDNNNYKIKGKRIVLEDEKDEDSLVNFREPTDPSGNYQNPKAFKFIGNKIYCNSFKNKSWINLNTDLDNNNIRRKIKNIKKWFRFKWFNLLLPIYVIDNKNVNEMLKYVWIKTNEYLRIKINFLELISLGLHPLQLIGSSTSICFRRLYKGNENFLSKFDRISKDSSIMWNTKSIKTIEEIIIDSLTWKYSYIGNFGLQREFLYPIIYLDYETLNLFNYPFNIALISQEIARRNNNKTLNTLENFKNNIRNNVIEKKEMINKYFSII